MIIELDVSLNQNLADREHECLSEIIEKCEVEHFHMTYCNLYFYLDKDKTQSGLEKIFSTVSKSIDITGNEMSKELVSHFQKTLHQLNKNNLEVTIGYNRYLYSVAGESTQMQTSRKVKEENEIPKESSPSDEHGQTVQKGNQIAVASNAGGSSLSDKPEQAVQEQDQTAVTSSVEEPPKLFSWLRKRLSFRSRKRATIDELDNVFHEELSFSDEPGQTVQIQVQTAVTSVEGESTQMQTSGKVEAKDECGNSKKPSKLFRWLGKRLSFRSHKQAATDELDSVFHEGSLLSDEPEQTVQEGDQTAMTSTVEGKSTQMPTSRKAREEKREIPKGSSLSNEPGLTVQEGDQTTVISTVKDASKTSVLSVSSFSYKLQQITISLAGESSASCSDENMPFPIETNPNSSDNANALIIGISPERLDSDYLDQMANQEEDATCTSSFEGESTQMQSSRNVRKDETDIPKGSSLSDEPEQAVQGGDQTAMTSSGEETDIFKESKTEQVNQYGKKIEVGGCFVTFKPGTFIEPQVVTVTAKIDFKMVPIGDQEVISPTLSIDANNLKKPAKIKLHTWCMEDEVGETPIVNVRHFTKSTNKWNIIHKCPLPQSRFIEFECQNFSDLFATIERIVFGLYAIEPNVYISDHKFAIALLLDDAVVRGGMRQKMSDNFQKEFRTVPFRVKKCKKHDVVATVLAVIDPEQGFYFKRPITFTHCMNDVITCGPSFTYNSLRSACSNKQEISLLFQILKNDEKILDESFDYTWKPTDYKSPKLLRKTKSSRSGKRPVTIIANEATIDCSQDNSTGKDNSNTIGNLVKDSGRYVNKSKNSNLHVMKPTSDPKMHGQDACSSLDSEEVTSALCGKFPLTGHHLSNRKYPRLYKSNSSESCEVNNISLTDSEEGTSAIGTEV